MAIIIIFKQSSRLFARASCLSNKHRVISTCITYSSQCQTLSDLQTCRTDFDVVRLVIFYHQPKLSKQYTGQLFNVDAYGLLLFIVKIWFDRYSLRLTDFACL